jgi:hypothetical protein
MARNERKRHLVYFTKNLRNQLAHSENSPKILVFILEKRDMATNPIGKDTKTIGLNMNQKMADELEKRASSMHLSTSKYCKVILTEWLKSKQKLKLQEK